MYWKHFLSLSQSWSLIHTGYNELFLKAGAELGLGLGGSEEKEEEEEGRSVRRNRRGESSRGELAMVGPTEPAVEKRRTEVGPNARIFVHGHPPSLQGCKHLSLLFAHIF